MMDFFVKTFPHSAFSFTNKRNLERDEKKRNETPTCKLTTACYARLNSFFAFRKNYYWGDFVLLLLFGSRREANGLFYA